MFVFVEPTEACCEKYKVPFPVDRASQLALKVVRPVGPIKVGAPVKGSTEYRSMLLPAPCKLLVP